MARKAIGKAINVKVTPASLGNWRAAAMAAGVDLSGWIRSVCDRAAVDVWLVDVPLPADKPTRFKRVQVQEPSEQPRELSAKQQALKEFLANR